MSLVTRCPLCGTSFKVVRDQLRISDGWVRCGRCSEVFDAAAGLSEVLDGTSPVASADEEVLAEPGSAVPPSPPADEITEPMAQNAAVSLRAFREELLALRLDLPSPEVPPSDGTVATLAPPETFPDPAAPPTPATAEALGAPRWSSEPAVAPGPSVAAVPVVVVPALNASTQDPEPPSMPSPPLLPLETAAALPLARPAAADLDADVDADLDVAAVAETGVPSSPAATTAPADVPSWAAAPPVASVASGSVPAESVAAPPGWPLFAPGRRRLLVAVLLAALVLMAQVLRSERNALVAHYPGLRPLLSALCAASGCELSPLRQIAAISVDGASFTHATTGDGYQLDFVLRNAQSVPLATPAVQLSLLDIQERTVVRRVLLPTDFGAPAALPARAEHAVSLPLALSGPEAATLPPIAGFRLEVFYP